MKDGYKFKICFYSKNVCEKIRKAIFEMKSSEKIVDFNSFKECYSKNFSVDISHCTVSLKEVSEELEVILWLLDGKMNDLESINNAQKTYLEGTNAFIYVPNKIREEYDIVDGLTHSIKDIKKIYDGWGAEVPEVIKDYLEEEVLIKPFIIDSNLSIEENLEKIITNTAKELIKKYPK